MSSAYQPVNAWREILARVFDDPDLLTNVSPDWLVNPGSGRRLKLDCLCRPLGVAVRFSGLTSKGQRRRQRPRVDGGGAARPDTRCIVPTQ